MLQWASGYTNPRLKWKLVADWQLLQVHLALTVVSTMHSLELPALCDGFTCFVRCPVL